MAAKLKKRALAEYQSQVLSSDNSDTKRLKLLLRGSPSIEGVKDAFLSLDSNSTSREVLETLGKLSKFLLYTLRHLRYIVE